MKVLVLLTLYGLGYEAIGELRFLCLQPFNCEFFRSRVICPLELFGAAGVDFVDDLAKGSVYLKRVFGSAVRRGLYVFAIYRIPLFPVCGPPQEPMMRSVSF